MIVMVYSMPVPTPVAVAVLINHHLPLASIEEVVIHLKRALDRKRLDAEQLLRVHLALGGAEDLRGRVELLQALFQREELTLLHEVGLVDQDAVRKRHLNDHRRPSTCTRSTPRVRPRRTASKRAGR